MAKSLVVTGPVLTAIVLVVVIEGAATHAILRESSPLAHLLVAIAHVSVIVAAVLRFVTTRLSEAPARGS